MHPIIKHYHIKGSERGQKYHNMRDVMCGRSLKKIGKNNNLIRVRQNFDFSGLSLESGFELSDGSRLLSQLFLKPETNKTRLTSSTLQKQNLFLCLGLTLLAKGVEDFVTREMVYQINLNYEQPLERISFLRNKMSSNLDS